MTRACLELARAREAGRPAAASTLDRPFRRALPRCEKKAFSSLFAPTSCSRTLPCWFGPKLAALGLNSFQAAACEPQRHGATIMLTSPNRQIAAGAHRFEEAEIKQFLDDFLRGPASQARW